MAVQGIANVFNIAVNVLSSENLNMIRVEPMNASVEHEVYIGLVLQYHYVGLDKLSHCDDHTSSNVENTTANPTDDTDDPLSDEKIAEGDEHIRQITGGLQASMMSLENPEALGKYFP